MRKISKAMSFRYLSSTWPLFQIYDLTGGKKPKVKSKRGEKPCFAELAETAVASPSSLDMIELKYLCEANKSTI
jgi:hypothetical protein